jgi:hypothetical protein
VDTEIEKCSGLNCADYRGSQTKTRSGKTCQEWTRHRPHKHNLIVYDDDRLNFGIGHHNYCRNPKSEIGETIWCYTTDPSTLWEYCDPLTPSIN